MRYAHLGDVPSPVSYGLDDYSTVIRRSTDLPFINPFLSCILLPHRRPPQLLKRPRQRLRQCPIVKLRTGVLPPT